MFSTTINWVLQQASTRDGEASVEKKKKNTTVHENNPHQTYKLIYGLIKQGNLNQVWDTDSSVRPRNSLMKLLIDEGHE